MLLAGQPEEGVSQTGTPQGPFQQFPACQARPDSSASLPSSPYQCPSRELSLAKEQTRKQLSANYAKVPERVLRTYGAME